MLSTNVECIIEVNLNIGWIIYEAFIVGLTKRYISPFNKALLNMKITLFILCGILHNDIFFWSHSDYTQSLICIYKYTIYLWFCMILKELFHIQPIWSVRNRYAGTRGIGIFKSLNYYYKMSLIFQWNHWNWSIHLLIMIRC